MGGWGLKKKLQIFSNYDYAWKMMGGLILTLKFIIKFLKIRERQQLFYLYIIKTIMHAFFAFEFYPL